MTVGIGIVPWALLVVVLVIAGLIGAASSGRVWSVLVALIGALLLAGGGFLLAGVLLFKARSENVFARMDPPKTVSQHEIRAAPPLPAEAPELFSNGIGSISSPQRGERIVERADQPEAPSGPPRPAWLDAPKGLVRDIYRTPNGAASRTNVPQLVGDVYRTTVTVGPWLTRTECEQQLPDALRDAVKTYADRLLGEGKGQYVNLDMSYIHNHIVRGEWEERRQQTIDTMIYLHELIEFDREANNAIEANYKQSVVAGRLGYTAAGGGVVLGLLTILFGYLKLDTLTRGYYTGRLRLTAATAILTLAVIAGLLVLA